MASVIQRKNSYYVVYTYIDENGARKQKWEAYKTAADAKKRKTEIEFKEQLGTFTVPKCRLLSELLEEYVGLYGKNRWAVSTYQGNVSLIEHYINPYIGNNKISEINTRVLERFYQDLLKTKAAERKVFGVTQKSELRLVSTSTVRDVHKLLRNCFNQAVKWELMERNPAVNATVPKHVSKKRDIWTAETLFHALQVCESDRLKLALNLAFSCSLRIGEMLALTWDCVDISPESIEDGNPYIYINKELQRLERKALDAMDKKDIICVFPAMSLHTTTIQVLKSPKTESSVRKIFLPKTVANMLAAWKKEQDFNKEALGSEYQDFNLVFANPLGNPIEASTIRGELKTLIEENDLPPVVFHSFRHSSITYKLKLNGGDVKSVQGDSGHAQTKMVTDLYAHILDDDRRINAQRFEEAFYSGRNGNEAASAAAAEAVQAAEKGGIDPAQLAKILSDPAMAALIKSLAANIK